MHRIPFKRVILSATALILAGNYLFAPTAHANAAADTLINLTVGAIDSLIAGIMNTLLWVMHWFVVFSGALLNVSINLTLHIKDFVDHTQGVYLVWQTVRDISGLFIIFVLLYCSFLLILNQTSKSFGSVGNLIKNIVIAGILINFSFFIVSLLIDASNIASLAIYNGIVGTSQTSTSGGASVGDQVQGVISGNGVGLGDIFMNKLKLQKAYAPGSLDLGDPGSPTPAPLKTLLQGIVGIVIMFTSGMSFILAAAAFAARLIILIILLAFSPILFAAWVFPILKTKADHYTDVLKGQLIFMPVYLLLLYSAMLILTKSTIFNDTATSALNGSVSTGAWIPKDLIVLAINDFFIIFLLNLPLVTAFSFAGSSVKWLEGGLKRFNAENVWQNVGRWAGRNTYERTASRIARSKGFQTFAAKGVANIPLSQFVGEAALKGTRGIASRYDKNLDERVKEREEFAKSLNIDRASKRQYASSLATSIPARVGHSMFGVMGRANRVAAAKILKERSKEIDTEINKFDSEERTIMQSIARNNIVVPQLPAVGSPPAAIDLYKQQIAGLPPQEKGYAERLLEIYEDRQTAQNEKVSIIDELDTFTTKFGVSNSQIRRRLY